MTEIAATTQLPAGLWIMDPAASSAGFTAHQLGRAVPGGIPLTLATVDLGPDRHIRSAHIELDIAAIATGNAKRDSDLAKPGLLNTGEFPAMTVDIGRAEWAGDGWHAKATIGIRGVAFDVDVAIVLQAAESDGVVRVLVTSAFDRKPIGMKVPRIAIGRNVEISVQATFTHE